MANTNASVKKKNTRNTVLRVLLYVVIIAICLITLYPYFVTVCTALKSRAEIFSMTLTAATRAQAKRFCERWPSRAPFLYQTIMEQLGEADTEKNEP